MGLIKRRVQRFQAELNELRCPHCRRVARADATVCSHCGRDMPAPVTKPLTAAAAARQAEAQRMRERPSLTAIAKAGMAVKAAARRGERDMEAEKVLARAQEEPEGKTAWPSP